jgi:Activator of Hsp90 ATPase homolog 1-like protein
VPENYHTLTYTLEDAGGRTLLALRQDNNASAEEARHSSANWQRMLETLRSVVESTP